MSKKQQDFRFGEVHLKFEDHRDQFKPEDYIKRSSSDRFREEEKEDTLPAAESSPVTEKSPNSRSKKRKSQKEQAKEQKAKTQKQQAQSGPGRQQTSKRPETPQKQSPTPAYKPAGTSRRRRSEYSYLPEEDLNEYVTKAPEAARKGGIPLAVKIIAGVAAVAILIGVGAYLYWDRKPPELVAQDQSIQYGGSVKVSELVTASDNRCKDVALSVDSITPEGAELSQDGTYISFENVGTYTITVKGVDDFNNSASTKTTISVIDYVAPSFAQDTADTFTVGYGKPVKVINTAATAVSTEDSQDTEEAQAVTEDESTVDEQASAEGDAALEEGSETDAAAQEEEAEVKEDGENETAEAEATEAASDSTDASELDSDYTIPVIATDEVSQNVAVLIVSLEPKDGQDKDSFTFEEDTVTFHDIGRYEAVLQAMDDDGNTAVKTVTIQVVDKIEPEITKTEDSYTVAYGEKIRAVQEKKVDSTKNTIYVTAKDEMSGVKLKIIKVTPQGKLKTDSYKLKDGLVKFYELGTYEVTVQAADEAKNKTAKIVTVEAVDETDPELENVPSSIKLTTEDTAYDWQKDVSATDEIDGDLSDFIKVDDSAVEFGKEGTYKIRYSVEDKAGNTDTKSCKVIIKKPATTKAKEETKATTEAKKKKN